MAGLNREELASLQTKLEQLRQKVVERLGQATAKQPEQSSPAGESKADRESECIELRFLEPLTGTDISAMGLALLRLEEACEDYIDSNGEEETSTFPCVSGDREHNMKKVRELLPRAERLRRIMFQMREEFLNLSLRDCILDQARQFSSLLADFIRRAG